MAESKIPLMEDDVEIIKKLGNKPGSENKLQTPELKSKFDEGSVLLKAHLNKVIGILNTLLGSAGGLLDGGNMMGALNMNGYRLFGISNPTDWDHAANKGYVDANKVDKTNVVNNFTTTEEGYVADARALKILNDSKLSSRLLWQNIKPGNAFSPQTLNLDFEDGDLIGIQYCRRAGSSVSRTVWCLGTADVELFNAWSSMFTTRNVYVSNGEIVFYEGKTSVYNNNGTLTEDNSCAIPTHIFVIKGVIK